MKAIDGVSKYIDCDWANNLAQQINLENSFSKLKSACVLELKSKIRKMK